MPENTTDDHDQLSNPDSLAHLIVMRNPTSNNQYGIEYTTPGTETGRRIIETLRTIISPKVYPHALDAFAGNGMVAKILVSEGWSPHDITCIDAYTPTRLLVPGTKWFLWHLGMLRLCLQNQFELPEEVEQQRGAYNLVMMVQSGQDAQELAVLVIFL